MNWKLAIAFTFVLSQSAFASSEAFQKVWNDSSGKHVLIIDKKLDSKDGGMTLNTRRAETAKPRDKAYKLADG
ncbi:hypothetical protein ACYCIT_24815, partial [Klebsiella pneumoniae]